jgi:archaemetzincin
VLRVAILALVVVACSEPRDAAPGKPAKPAKPPAASPIGDVSGLSPELQRAFDPTDFTPAGKPRPGDWRAEHPEKPQTFDQYIRSQPNVPTDRRKVIYLLPLGEFAPGAPAMPALAAIVHAYFTLEVRVLPAVPIADVKARTRQHDGARQLLAPEVLAWLTKRIPDDAYAVMALTMTDLYPEDSWNFVFGMASFTERVGVQSFARHDPAFFGQAHEAGWEKLALRRATWTVVHEVAHMFGLAHCAHYQCAIAGSNNQDESDRAPLHPCPVCLHKLQWAIEFDPAAREEALAKTLGDLGIADEAAWSARRAQWIRTGSR